VTQRRLNLEHARPRWLRECLAEATGVFFYVFPGIAAVTTFTLAAVSPVESQIGAAAFGSLLTIGWAFAIGIAFAILICAPTSGGHFNPAITIALAVWQGFPWRKVPYYIFSQIFGAFIAGLVVIGMYWPQVQEFKAGWIALGRPLVGNGAPASILCSFPNVDQTNLGYVFMTEFFVDSFLATVIWACLDPANPFVSPAGVPFVIGLAYGSMAWGFADITISTNMARDLGCRIVAAIFFGGEAFSYMNYSPISILVSIPATLFATGYYELVLKDSFMWIAKGHASHEEGEDGLMRHISRAGMVQDDGVGMNGVERGAMSSATDPEKGVSSRRERV
jgi:glycerol uptake facilitator-like aquaporin